MASCRSSRTAQAHFGIFTRLTRGATLNAKCSGHAALSTHRLTIASCRSSRTAHARSSSSVTSSSKSLLPLGPHHRHGWLRGGGSHTAVTESNQEVSIATLDSSCEY